MVSSDPPAEAADQHVIDTSHYVPPEPDEKTEALLSMSVCIDPHSPFDEATISGFLKKIRPPLEQREGYVLCNQHVPCFSGCQFVNLGRSLASDAGQYSFCSGCGELWKAVFEESESVKLCLSLLHHCVMLAMLQF